MKATIIRKIEKEIKDFSIYHPYYYENEYLDLMKTARVGEPPTSTAEFKQYVYEGVHIFNPETKLRELYYVKTDDKKLFEDLMIVSQIFIDKQINKERERFYEDLMASKESTQKSTTNSIKNLPWWKRLFNKF